METNYKKPDKQQVSDQIFLSDTVQNVHLNGVDVSEANDGQKESEKESERLKTKAKVFIRVGDSYYKHVLQPGKNDGEFFKHLLKVSKTTITDDHSPKIIKHIYKYDDFVLRASHTNYQQNIGTFYNKYHQITHQPKQGTFPVISSLIKHLFGEPYTEFAFDYLALLYHKPTQPLPIILLESEAKNTGKSTFGNLIYWIFQDNVVKAGNNDLQSDFNSVWVERLVVVVDETQLDKSSVTQMLKRYSTETGKVVINEKNKSQREIDFIGKFIFCSNQEGRALFIERNDPRWAVFKVPTLAESGLEDNPQIEQTIKAEIPAFLYFLLHRQLKYPQKSRMYFAPKVYHTDQLEVYYRRAFTRTAKAIQQLVVDTHDHCPNQTEICFSIANIIEEIKGEGFKTDRQSVKDALEKELGLAPNSKGRYDYYSRTQMDKAVNLVIANDQNNKFYRFDLDIIQTWKNTISDFF